MNHGTNLLSEASHKGEGKVVKEMYKESNQESFGDDLAAAIAEASNEQLSSMDEDDRQAVPQIIRAVSKMFSTEGGHGDYHLNESKHFTEWCRQWEIKRVVSVAARVAARAARAAMAAASSAPTSSANEESSPPTVPVFLDSYKPRTLPSVKGSRMIIMTELPAAIASNIELYMAYMDQNRTDSNPNKLVRHAWDGLSDKFIVAAILTRAVEILQSDWPTSVRDERPCSAT